MTKVIEINEGIQRQAAHEFYKDVLTLLSESKCDFLVGGGFALRLYTDLMRDTKDLDIFCKSGDCPRILKQFTDNGYETELTDARWLAKAIRSAGRGSPRAADASRVRRSSSRRPPLRARRRS